MDQGEVKKRNDKYIVKGVRILSGLDLARERPVPSVPGSAAEAGR